MNTPATLSNGSATAPRPTPETYDPLETLYDEANTTLFDGQLPSCLITLQRHPKAFGFFSLAKFAKGGEWKADEIALNPSRLIDCTTLDLLVVLVHQMIHIWQAYFGHPGRGGYHNRQFAEQAKTMGLMPSDTGEPGGKETGDRISHYVREGGTFHAFAVAMERRGVGLNWMEVTERRDNYRANDPVGETRSKSGKRVRYVCKLDHTDDRGVVGPLIVLARARANIQCGEHGVRMEPS